jgi:hypothetical protein
MSWPVRWPGLWLCRISWEIKMITKIYPKGFYHILKGQIALDGAGIKALLLKNTYTFSNSHEFVSDLTPASNEITGGSYVRQTMTNVITVSGDAAIVTPSANVVFPLVSGAARYMVVYKNVTNDNDSLLVCLIDFGYSSSLTLSNLTIVLNSLIEGVG